MKKNLKNIIGIFAVFFVLTAVQYGRAETKIIKPPGTDKSFLNQQILPPGVLPGDGLAPAEENQPTTTVQTIKLKSTIAPRLQGVVLDGNSEVGAPLAGPAGQFFPDPVVHMANRLQKVERTVFVAFAFGGLGLALGIFNLFLRRKDKAKRLPEIV